MRATIRRRLKRPPARRRSRLNAYRAMEKQEKKYHVSLVDRSVEAATAPPFVIAVVGPPGVGKSTLIQSPSSTGPKQNLARSSAR